MTNYLDLSFEEINYLLKTKKIKPIDLVMEAFQKIEANDYNAFITLDKESAIKKAEELENKEVDNILFALPIAIKDNIVTKGIKTTCASSILKDFIPVYNADVINFINEKNMIIIGKSNMDEFAMGSTGETSYFGNTLNPWNEKKVPGGSSSGSAVCVSSRMVACSLGTDTGGSIRQPASFTGIVGLKPTYGLISRYGLVSFASSLDCIGPMTKTVKDNAYLLNVLTKKNNNDLTSKSLDKDYTSLIGKDIKNLKIAIPNYYISEKTNNEVKNKVLETAKMLEKLGCQIDYIDIKYLEYAISLYQIIALAEASSNLARYDGIKYGTVSEDYNDINSMYKNTRSKNFGNEVKRRIMIGSYTLSGDNANLYYYKALKLRRALTNSLKEVFNNYDLIIGPTNTGVAYDLGIKLDDPLKSFYDDILTIPVNMAGLPSLSMPIGFNSEHLPIGLQIIGNYYQEDLIYQLGSFLENALKLDLNPKGGNKDV